jgi:hypothetical protein
MTIAGAVILAAIAGTLHWKKYAPRFVAWLLFLVGLGAATEIMKYVGAFTKMSIKGVGIITLIAIVTGIVFYAEAVKRHGIHRVRTPIVAVLLGVSLISMGGSIGHAVQQANKTGGKNVDKSVTTTFKDKGKG